MTIHELIHNATDRLQTAGITTPGLDAQVLLEYASGRSRTWLRARAHDPVDTCLHGDSLPAYEKLIENRARSVPVAYLTGSKEFYGCNFYVDATVMIPRPESEALVDYALDNTPRNGHVLDAGTGCGALAVALKANRSDLNVTASDVSADAVAVASQNAEYNGVELQLHTSDLLTYITATFHTIVANLPYLRPGVELTPDADHEPGLALGGGGEDGLGLYRRFLHQAPDRLTAPGLVVLESDPWQHPSLIQCASDYGFRVRTQERFMLVFETAG